MFCCSIWSRFLYPGFNVLLRETGTWFSLTQKQDVLRNHSETLPFWWVYFLLFYLHQMDLTNYKSWHIPRASLSSASNSGQSSTDSIRDFDRRQSDATRHHRQQRKVVDGPQSMPSSSSSSAASINPKTHKNFDREKGQTKMEKLHRGSKSSQGSSSDGINSSHVSLGAVHKNDGFYW